MDKGDTRRLEIAAMFAAAMLASRSFQGMDKERREIEMVEINERAIFAAADLAFRYFDHLEPERVLQSAADMRREYESKKQKERDDRKAKMAKVKK